MKVVLIFSEGSHDVGFIKLVLEMCFNIKHEHKAKISNFIKPLDSVFGKLMTEHASIEDLSLNTVSKFMLPDYVFRTETHFIMLFNTGGKDNHSYVKKILSRIILKIKDNDGTFEFGENDISYLLIYDADYKNYQTKISEIKQSPLFPITVNDAETDTSEDSPENLLDRDNESIHFYIWPDNEKTGTLEDILLPIYSKKDNQLIDNSKNFIDQNFPTKFRFTEQITKENIQKKSDKWKACITIAGQGDRHGRSLTSIIADNVLADKDTFTSTEEVKKFSKFLKPLICGGVLWSN